MVSDFIEEHNGYLRLPAEEFEAAQPNHPFHCELNPIKRCWAQAKRYTRAYSNYTIAGLRRNVPDGLETVTLENIKNHYRKVRTYMFGYVQGFTAGPELEEHMKKCKKIYKSHRRVGVDE